MKRVIIVGNGKQVLNKTNGSLIDEYDIVVRLNRFRVKNYEAHVGTKTDIVVFNQSTFIEKKKIENNSLHAKQHFRINAKPTIQKYSVNKSLSQIKKFIKILKHNFTPYYENTDNAVHLLLFANTDNILHNFKSRYILYPPRSTDIFSSGFLTIRYFVENNYDVSITGFDFFQRSSYYWYLDHEYYSEKDYININTQNFTDNHPYTIEKILISKYALSGKLKYI